MRMCAPHMTGRGCAAHLDLDPQLGVRPVPVPPPVSVGSIEVMMGVLAHQYLRTRV